MGYIKYTDKPIGKLRQSKGMDDDVLKFGTRTKEDLLSQYGSLGSFMKQAIRNPGVLQVRYHEENHYEYEDRATYNEKENTMITNKYCPYSSGHHIGSTCGCCGQKD